MELHTRYGLLGLLRGLLLPCLIAVGCSDSSGPGDLDFPANFAAVSAEKTSEVRVYVRDGSEWNEVDAESTRFADHEYFASSAAAFDSSVAFTLLSDSTWRPSDDPTVSLPYTASGSALRLIIPSFGAFTATLDDDELIVDGLSYIVVVPLLGTSFEYPWTTLYDAATEPIDALKNEDVDTIAFHTSRVTLALE